MRQKAYYYYKSSGQLQSYLQLPLTYIILDLFMCINDITWLNLVTEINYRALDTAHYLHHRD